MFVTILMIALLYFLNQYFAGVVVAELPFEPYSFLQSITHRTLPGENMRETGVFFIYAISSFCIRPIVQRIVGVSPREDQTGGFAAFYDENKLKGW